MEYHYFWKHTPSWKETSLFNATVEPWCHSHWSLPVAPSSIHPWNARSVVLLPPILNLQQVYITLWIDHDRSIYIYIYIYIALPSCSYIYRSKPIYQEVPKKNMASLQKNLLTPVLHAILEALPRQKFHDLAGNLRKNTMNIPHSLPMGKFSKKKMAQKMAALIIHSSLTEKPEVLAFRDWTCLGSSWSLHQLAKVWAGDDWKILIKSASTKTRG